jgi:hypothetical protein
MKKNMKPTDRIKFMMSYDNKKTLNENLEEMNITDKEETDIDEAGVGSAEAKDMAKFLKGGAGEAEMIAKYAQNFGMEVDAVKLALAKNPTMLKNDLKAAIRKDAAVDFRVGSTNSLGPAAKEASKAIAIKEIMSRGANITDKEIIAIIEKTKNDSKTIARGIEGKATKSAATKSSNQATKDIKNADDAANKVRGDVNVNVTTGNITQGTASETAAAVQASKDVLPEAKVVAKDSAAVVKDMKPSKWEKFKNVAKKLKPKYLLYLGLAGVAGWALWKFFAGGTTKPENELFGKCLDDVIDDNGTSIRNTTAGDPVVTVKNTGNADYDSKGGLWFFNNGRVFMGDQSKRGRWSCKGKETVIAEQGDGNPNTGIGNINIQWDGDTSPVKTEPVKTEPVKTDNVNYHDCSSKDFPFEFGCISPKIAEIQGCLGITPQKGNFGPKTKKGLEDLHYDISGGITKETYDKIIAACKPASVSGSTSGTTANVTGATSGTTTTATAPITPPAPPTEPVFDKNRLEELIASKNLIKKRKGVIVKWIGPELSGNDYFILNKHLEDKGYIQKKQRETGDRDDEDVTMKYKWKLQNAE